MLLGATKDSTLAYKYAKALCDNIHSIGKEYHMMRQIMTECTEKSIAISFGNTDIFFNYFAASLSTE